MFRTAAGIALLLLAPACASVAPAAPSTSPRATAAPALWAGLQPGPYAVGFRWRLLRHQAADFKLSPPHLVQISVWYPAEDAGPAMVYGDYVALTASEKVFADPTEAERKAAVDEYVKLLTSLGVTDASARAYVGSPVYARREARGLPLKKFPLVFIAQGNGQPAASQAVLAEFLASHGYLVVTTPSITRETGEMTSPDQVGAKATEQADDIDRAASAIGDWPSAVNVPISVVGYSFGARGAVLYAMHHPVNAIVSLDGGIGSANGVDSFKSSALFDPAFKLPPILHFYEENDARMAPDLTFLRSLNTSKLELEKMTAMHHVHFSTLGFASILFPDIARATGAEPEVGRDVVATAARTLQFLDRIWAPVRPAP